MAYAEIEFDKTKFVRCHRCGVLKKRSHAPPLTFDQKVEILALRHGGYGTRAIAKKLGIVRSRVQYFLRKCDADLQN